MRGLLLAAVALALGSAAGAAERTGLHGFVTKGLLTPVCRADVPCEGPAAGVSLVFTDAAGHVFRTVTRPSGFYRLSIVPGRYEVSARGPGLRQALLRPRTARVTEGTDRRLDFHVDTGIQ